MTHPYRIKVTVRNNLLLTAINEAGYKTAAEFARAAELTNNDVGNLVAMRTPPIGRSGEFTKAAKVVMEVLGASPLDLWTDRQLMLRLPRNTGQAEVAESAVEAMIEHQQEAAMLESPEVAAERGELRAVIDGVLETLTLKEKKVLQLLYGVGVPSESTPTEVGDMFDVSCNRIGQIERKALMKLWHPSRVDLLVGAGVVDL